LTEIEGWLLWDDVNQDARVTDQLADLRRQREAQVARKAARMIVGKLDKTLLHEGRRFVLAEIFKVWYPQVAKTLIQSVEEMGKVQGVLSAKRLKGRIELCMAGRHLSRLDEVTDIVSDTYTWTGRRGFNIVIQEDQWNEEDASM
jgi:hypothetical protein